MVRLKHLLIVRENFYMKSKCVEIFITEMIQLYRKAVERSHKPIYMWGKKAVILAEVEVCLIPTPGLSYGDEEGTWKFRG